MVVPPALATDWIAGSFGSERATEDGGTLEVEVAADDAPVPPPSSEQPATTAASNTKKNRTRMIAPLRPGGVPACSIERRPCLSVDQL
jgi:hypothetical protein